MAGKLADAAAERIRQVTDQRIREIQSVPILGGKLIKDVELADDVDVTVAHGLGRTPAYFLSPPRVFFGGLTTGRITDRRLALYDVIDTRKVLVLRAVGWGGTVVVDIWVF